MDISKQEIKKIKKYVVLGHVRIMYIQNICIMKRPNASHVIVDICTIVVVFCVYQDEFLYLIGEGSESTPNVLFLKAWSPRCEFVWLWFSFKHFVDDWKKKTQQTSCIEVSGLHSPGGSGDCCWTKCPQVLSQGKTALVALCCIF